MEIRVVVVELIYQINLGYISRTCANFGVRELTLVNPRCKVDGKNAMKYAKHGLDVLKRARICRTVEEAVKGTFSIATTGNWRKGKPSLYNIYSIDSMASMLRSNSIGKVSVVLGRESTGLTTEEIAKCSTCAYIPVKGEYGILNISHALAILLYELTRRESRRMAKNPYASSAEMGNTLRLFQSMLESRKDIRDKAKIAMVMSRILERAHPTKGELATLAVALSLNKRKEKKGN